MGIETAIKSSNGCIEMAEIDLCAPVFEMFWPKETATADENAATFEVVEHGGAHAAVAGRCGEVVSIRAKDAFEATSSTS